MQVFWQKNFIKVSVHLQTKGLKEHPLRQFVLAEGLRCFLTADGDDFL